MRILISSTTYHPSSNGQAIFTTTLAEGLAARGHEVTVLFPSEREQAFCDVRNGVRLEHVRSSTILPFIHPDAWVARASSREIAEIFDKVQPQVVHFHDHYPPTGMVLREAKKRGIRIVGTNHFMPENIAPYAPIISRIKPLYNWIAWTWVLWAYNRADVVTAQSRAAAALIRSRGLKPPVFPVSCGIDLRRFHPDPTVDRAVCRRRYGLDEKKIIFLFVGRVDREKRVDVLLRAMSLLQRDDIQLAVAGKGAATGDYEALARKLQLGERVCFTGYIPNEDLHTLLNSVEIFSMPSEAELLSIASLEAMASGRPLLLADAVALPELVTPGVNGYLFKPGDAEDAAHYMGLLADQPERWAEMGAASAERALEHGLDKTLSKYEALYDIGVPIADLRLGEAGQVQGERQRAAPDMTPPQAAQARTKDTKGT